MSNQHSFGLWLDRSVGGDWISDRRYLYYSGDAEPKAVNLTTHFTVEKVAPYVYEVNWDGQTTGRMQLELAGDVLHRDIGYFTADPTDSHLEMVDEDTVVFRTAYGGVSYREEVRFIGDNLRLRQTIGRKDGELVIAGQYVERRS